MSGSDSSGFGVRERRDIWTLTREDEWHPVIEWYALAVEELRSITDIADSRSWLHLANIHGTDIPDNEWPNGVGTSTWNACQHGSWYFLPWHRIYLHHFEKIVRNTVIRSEERRVGK